MPKGIYTHKSLSENTKRKIGEASIRLGLIPPCLRGENHPGWKGGVSRFPICRCGKRLSSMKSKNCVKHQTLDSHIKIGAANSGRIRSQDTRLKMSIAHKGRVPTNGVFGRKGLENPRYILDRSLLAKKQERNDSAYKDWRITVYRRDNFKCKINNSDCSGRLEAHHILGWTEYPELRYEINNGITLCRAHHPKVRAEEKRLIPIFSGLVSVSK